MKEEDLRHDERVVVSNWQFIDGVDGSQLAKKSGRVTRKGRGKVHVSWTAGQTRVSREFSFGKSLQKGLVDIWGMVGCCLAHEKALATIAQKQLGPTLILESDAILSVTATEFQKMVHASLNAAPKQWLTVRLGCLTGGPAKSKRACEISRRRQEVFLAYSRALLSSTRVFDFNCSSAITPGKIGQRADA